MRGLRSKLVKNNYRKLFSNYSFIPTDNCVAYNSHYNTIISLNNTFIHMQFYWLKSEYEQFPGNKIIKITFIL